MMRLIEEHIYYMTECPLKGGTLDITKCLVCRFFKRIADQVASVKPGSPLHERLFCNHSTVVGPVELPLKVAVRGKCSDN